MQSSSLATPSGDVVFTPTGGGRGPRRLRPEELVDAVRRTHGVRLVEGVAAFDDARSATGYGGHLPIASTSLLADARFVDQTGARLVEWLTAPIPTDDAGLPVVCVFELSMGNGAPFPQPSGQFDLSIDGRQVLSFTLAKRPRRWSGGGCELLFDLRWLRTAVFGDAFDLDERIRSESTFASGFAALLVPPAMLTPGAPLRLRVTGTSREPSRSWARVGRPRIFADSDVLAPLVQAVLAPLERPSVDGQPVLLGDIHNHSGQSSLASTSPPGIGPDEGCGVGSREELFAYARDVAGLDFFCLSEHDWQMGAEDWQHLNTLTDRCSVEGSFVTLHGYEWTSPGYGHRNVYFRDEPGGLFHATDPTLPVNTIVDGSPTPADLWRWLDDQAVPALTVPHHMSARQFPLSLDHFHDERYDRVAEIYSSWGDSLEHASPSNTLASRLPELAFINAVRAGRRVGFIASSDSHDGHPGNAQGRSSHPHLYHFLGSGRAGVFVDEPSRQGIFDALRARRCFAATCEDLIVHTSLADIRSGEATVASRLSRAEPLRVRAGGFVPIAEVAIYRNGHVVDRLAGDGTSDVDLTWTDPGYDPAAPTSYFTKVVRADGESAWSSPLWIVP